MTSTDSEGLAQVATFWFLMTFFGLIIGLTLGAVR